MPSGAEQVGAAPHRLAVRLHQRLRASPKGLLSRVAMTRRAKLLFTAATAGVACIAFALYNHLTFPKDTTPEGAYARIVLAITRGHPRECFAYLETQAQWAAYTIRDYRSKTAAIVGRDYPEPEKSELLASYRGQADVADGADVWVSMAERRGFVARLRKDLSGAKRVEIAGERATIETARGTRYAFRRRDNGIWGLTTFTAELVAEAEKAARDYEMVTKSARDYERARAGSLRP
jgi:hypothetical protein